MVFARLPLDSARRQSNDGSMTDHTTAVLVEAFDRVHEAVPDIIDGLRLDQLTQPPAAGANPIGWLVWHLSRVEDDHVADLVGSEQVWTSAGFADQFGLPYDVSATGYGHSADDVAAFTVPDPHLLIDYYGAVHARTVKSIDGLGSDDWDRVVDENWDPPVTVAVRLVSVVNDITQHIGQAAYVRGIVDG